MVQIVPIEISHLESYHAALGVVARERKYIAWLDAPPLEASRQYLEESLKNDMPQFVAVEGDKVVGWCDVTPNARPVFRHVGSLGIGLLPEYRGRGIGKELMLATLRKAKAQGLERVELTVYHTNQRAIALYERAGFKHEGTRPRSAKIDGQYLDQCMMGLSLDGFER